MAKKSHIMSHTRPRRKKKLLGGSWDALRTRKCSKLEREHTWTAEVDEIDKPTDEDVSSENATFFNYVRMSRVRRPLGPTDEDVSSENVDSELIVYFTTGFRTWAC